MFSGVPGICRGLWEVLEAPLELPGWSLGVHLGSLSCLNGIPGGSLGALWRPGGGPWGAPGGAWGSCLFLGRSGSGFREFPGDSGSHFGSILASFFYDFPCFFGLCFLIDFRVDFASIFVEFWMMCLNILLIFFVEFAKTRKCEN